MDLTYFSHSFSVTFTLLTMLHAILYQPINYSRDNADNQLSNQLIQFTSKGNRTHSLTIDVVRIRVVTQVQSGIHVIQH